MGGKEFNILDECTARCVHVFTAPSGRRSASHITPTEISKTGAITKVKVLMF